MDFWTLRSEEECVGKQKDLVDVRLSEVMRLKAFCEASLKEIMSCSLMNNEAEIAADQMQTRLKSLGELHKKYWAGIGDVHELYTMQLSRLRSDAEAGLEQVTARKQLTVGVTDMLCSKNAIIVVNQLHNCQEKWILSIDQSLLLCRKILTELFETFAACVEGSTHFSGYIEQLIAQSKYLLDELRQNLESVGHYLQPAFTTDYEHRDPDYVSKASDQFDRLRTMCSEVLDSMKKVWSVERPSVVDATGLNANEQEALQSEKDLLAENVSNTGGFDKRSHGGALSSILRLKCSSRNVAQPVFYQRLLRRTDEPMSLGELKSLLKSASEEFHQLMKVFSQTTVDEPSLSENSCLEHCVLRPPNLKDICKELSDILTCQEVNLLKLFDLSDTGISTLSYMIDQFLSHLRSPAAEDGVILEYFKGKLMPWYNLLEVSTLQEIPAENEHTECINKKNNVHLPLDSELVPHPLVSMEATATKRLGELNEHLAQLCTKLEQNARDCQLVTGEWISRSLHCFCINKDWVETVVRSDSTSDLTLDSPAFKTNTPSGEDHTLTSSEFTPTYLTVSSENQSLEAQETSECQTDPCEQFREKLDPKLNEIYLSPYVFTLNSLEEDDKYPQFLEAKRQFETQAFSLVGTIGRILGLYKYSKSPGIADDCEKRLVNLKAVTEQLTAAWQFLYDELLLNAGSSFNRSPETQVAGNETALPETGTLLDFESLRAADNQQGYVCIDSIDFITTQKRSLQSRRDQASERLKKAEEAIKVELEENQKIEEELDAREKQLEEMKLLALADIENETE